MLCPRCHGTHVVVTNGCRLPCPECGGVGEIHCCDGLQEQVDSGPMSAATPAEDHRTDRSPIPDKNPDRTGR